MGNCLYWMLRQPRPAALRDARACGALTACVTPAPESSAVWRQPEQHLCAGARVPRPRTVAWPVPRHGAPSKFFFVLSAFLGGQACLTGGSKNQVGDAGQGLARSKREVNIITVASDPTVNGAFPFLSENNGLLFLETSALNSTNVELAFETVLKG